MCVSYLTYKKVYVTFFGFISNRYLVPFSSLFLHDTLVVTPRGDNKPDSSKTPETHTHTHKTLQRHGGQMQRLASVGEKTKYSNH